MLMLGYARILGPEQFGSLVGSQAKVIIWAMLVDLGLSHGLIGALTAAENQKENAGRQSFRASDLLFRVLGIRLLGAGIGALAVVFLASLSPDQHSFRQDISFIPFLFALALQQTSMAYANFRSRQGLSVAAMLIGNLASVLLCLYLAFHGANLSQLLLAQSWGGILTAIIIFISFWNNAPEGDTRRREQERGGPWVQEVWRALLRDAWPYAVIYGCGVLWNRLDQIVATHFLGNESGGQYALAVRLVAIPTILASSIGIALFPDLQRVGMDAPEKITTYVGAATKFFYRYGIPLVALFLFLVALIIAPVVPKFREALWLLPWFVPGVWAYFLHSFSVSSLYAVRRYREAVWAHLIALIFYCLALPLLAWSFALPGIALAFDLFGCVLFFLSLRALRASQVLPKGFSLASEFSAAEKELLQALWSKIRLRREIV